MSTPEMKPLLSIEEEAAACREAFEGVKLYSLVVHCHHEVLFEILTELAENRIAYILSHKPRNEQALRLRLFRPVSKEALKKYPKLDKARAELDKASAEWDKARADKAIHADICPDCPWNGHTIFPRKP